MRDFVDALARVPGIPATEYSPLEIEQLSSKAEHVIAAIERHIEDDADQESARQSLGEEIDAMRPDQGAQPLAADQLTLQSPYLEI